MDLDFGWKEVSISRSTVTVGGQLHEVLSKSGKPRKVPLTDTMIEEIRQHVEGKNRNDWIFTNASDARVNADSFRCAFEVATRTTGRLDMNPHTCRDTFASWVISAQVPITVVSDS